MTDQDRAHQRWLDENLRVDAQRAHDKNHEYLMKINEAAVNAANIALRTAVLINGGAAIALLAFIGGIVSNGKLPVGEPLTKMAAPLIYFAVGVALATFAMALAYFTNFSAVSTAANFKKLWVHPFLETTPASKRWNIAYYIFIILSVITALTSLGIFVVGMWEVKNAISLLQPPRP